MSGRMAAAAVTCGTPGGKSQDLLPASPPPRQGAQLYRPRRGAQRGRPLLLLWFAPTARFRPPPPRQGAPLRVGPHRGPAVMGLPGGPSCPRCPSPLVRACTLLRSFSRTSLSAGGRQDPSTSELLPGPPPHLRGAPPAGSSPLQAAEPGLRTCAWWRSPYPNPRSRARRGLPAPHVILGHLAEPALRASSSFHLFPQEGGGSGWSQSGRWCREAWRPWEKEAFGKGGERGG